MKMLLYELRNHR